MSRSRFNICTLLVSLFVPLSMSADDNDQPATNTTEVGNNSQQESDQRHLRALSVLASELEKHKDVLRATAQYTALLNQKGPHLTATVSIEPNEEVLAVNDMTALNVKTVFRPFQCERYEWHIAVVTGRLGTSDFSIQTSASGLGQRKSQIEIDVSAPTEKPGEFELRLLVFGRPQAHRKFDLLDYTTLRYTVRPVMK